MDTRRRWSRSISSSKKLKKKREFSCKIKKQHKSRVSSSIEIGNGVKTEKKKNYKTIIILCIDLVVRPVVFGRYFARERRRILSFRVHSSPTGRDIIKNVFHNINPFLYCISSRVLDLIEMSNWRPHTTTVYSKHRNFSNDKGQFFLFFYTHTNINIVLVSAAAVVNNVRVLRKVSAFLVSKLFAKPIHKLLYKVLYNTHTLYNNN